MSESPVQDEVRKRLEEGQELSTRQLAGDDKALVKAYDKALSKMRERGEIESRKVGISLRHRLAQLVRPPEEVFTLVKPRFGGWKPGDGEIPDVWSDDRRTPGHRCLWSVNFVGRDVPRHPVLDKMSVGMLLFELRDVADRHVTTSSGHTGVIQGQKGLYVCPPAHALYEAILDDGQPRRKEVIALLKDRRQYYPSYVWYDGPESWPPRLAWGGVQFRPGWPAPKGNRQKWGEEAFAVKDIPLGPPSKSVMGVLEESTNGAG